MKLYGKEELMFEQLHPYLEERTAQNEFSGVVRITQGDHEHFIGAYGFASRTWQIRRLGRRNKVSWSTGVAQL